MATVSERVYQYGIVFAAVAALLFGASFFVQNLNLRTGLVFSSGVSGAILVLSWMLSRGLRQRRSFAFSALQGVIENAPRPQIVLNLNGKVLLHNKAAERQLGLTEESNLAEVLSSKVADPQAFVARLISNAEQHGAAIDLITSRGGAKITVNRVGDDVFLLEYDESFGGNNGTSAARVPMMAVGRTGAILFMNPAAREFLGERRKKLSEIFGDAPILPGAAQEIITENGARQCLVAEYEGSAGRREIYLLPTDVPTVQRDLIVFDELPVALLKVAPNGRVLMANRMARRLVDKPIDSSSLMSNLMEGLGRSIEDWLAEAAAGHGKHHSEFLRLKRQDREIFIQVTLNRVVEGDETSLIAVLNDATELKRLEAQFVQSQKMQAIGQLAGGVAHDFNNLLTAISGHCDLLLLRHDQGDLDYGDLVQINQNSNRAAALVGQLLAFSRKQNLRPEVLDLCDTLADLTHLLNRLVGEKITLSLSHDPVLPTIRADKRQLEQVLMNLVVNARDAMPDGGEIRVQTESFVLEQPMTRDRVVVPPGRFVSVKVADEGMGISPDKLQKVFEPFYTTKRTGEGTGLGLSTAYGIVKQTGGYIFVDSVVGNGTCFTLLFPVNEVYEQAEKLVKTTKAETAANKVGDGVILLVEDEAPVRAFASRALKLRGYTVIEADSGEAALTILSEENPHVDLFVTDVIMPGQDGPTWVRKAREERPDVGVVFVSGYAEDSFSDNQARIKGSVFLPKPFSLRELTEVVNQQLQ